MSKWLDWAKQLNAISQAGKTYSKDKYDLERFDQVAHISHQMFAELSDQPVEKVASLFVDEVGYPTPKIDLRAGVIQNGKILLVKEREDSKWTLPGGWGDVCETPTQGVIREVLEESGYIVDSPRLVSVKDRAVHPYAPPYPFHIYKMFFLCELKGGEPTINIEVSEIDWFSPNELPALSEGRTRAEDIEYLFDALENPEKPVYID
ncbi:hypothetical protein JCM19232_788 [Vibrio ishigakensis]|uniref:Nudix hydrolase domain-containing protein n=1 Tax=Vibrio ishigakensis TaxID=1481914 RepID=A0A0B8P112_9VIBR|nr:hypothetical protein JCM19232_788 [Vibrio ishigakensis]